MKYKRLTWVLVITLVVLFSAGVSAFIFDYKVFETDHFVIFYPKGCKYQAEEVLYYLEKYRKDTMDLVGSKEDFKSLVVLQNAGLNSYGGAVPLNYRIDIYTNNPSTLSRIEGLEGYSSWFKQVAVHEFTHLAQGNNASGVMKKIAKVAGSHYSPNNYVPDWLTEGIAVYNESRLNQYEGRLNNGYYQSFIASRANSGKLPDLIEVPYGDNEYIYGAEFCKYLADTYGEEKFAEFFKDYSDNFTAFVGVWFPAVGINKTAKEVYGKAFPELFKEWKQHEEEKYKGWEVKGEQIVQNKLGKFSRLIIHEDKLYYIKNEVFTPKPFTKNVNLFLVEYNLKTGEEKVIEKLDYSSNASLQVKNNKLYYSVKPYGVGVLYSYNLDTGWTKRELVETFNDFVVLETGDIIYLKDNKDSFGSEIWKSNGDREKKIGEVDQLISEIRAYKDGFIVVSKKRLGSWNINYLKLNNDDSGGEGPSLKPIVNSPYVEKFINLEEDKVYFTANYDNKHAVYRYDLTTEQLKKVTRESYAVNGVTDDNEKLYFVGLNNQGEGIYESKINSDQYSMPEPETVKEFDMDLEREEKNAFIKNLSYFLKPYIRFPYLEGQDVLGLTSYRIEYLTDFNSTLSRQISVEPYTQASVTNFETEEESRETNLSFSYSSYPYLGDLVVGESTFYLRGGREKEYLFRNCSLNLTASAFYSYSKRGKNLIPAYSDFSEVAGASANAQFTHKLWEIEKGIWNPNIFVGNIYGNAFTGYYRGYLFENFDPYFPYETSFNDSYQNIDVYTYGYEFLFEVMTGFEEEVVPTLGVEVYNSQDVEPYYKIKPYFNFKIYF